MTERKKRHHSGDQFQAAEVEEAAAGHGGLSGEKLHELVMSSDFGARAPGRLTAMLILVVAISWSLFQLWIASPLPFMLRFGVFNDTEARSFHLAFALFLAFLAYPSPRSPVQLTLAVGVPLLLAALFVYGLNERGEPLGTLLTREAGQIWWIAAIALAMVVFALLPSPKDHVPIWDWILAAAGVTAALYGFVYYAEIVTRIGRPITADLVISVLGLIVLLEATRRTLGPALMVIATVFLVYTFLGTIMPDLIAHKGNSLSEVASHQWITTEGVFGIALGVSTSFVFLFVLFGALLDKAGAGNYFIQVAFSLMGHMRGGPAKAAVVSSAMTGLISGSSIANVVTTGTFTIPLMKKVGLSSEKAGAIEVASSVNGQIMPPVMGAAAFLMVEYVGIPYFDVVRHAILPATITYIALVYIVHLEAVKAGMKGMERAYVPKPWIQRLMGIAVGIVAISLLSFGVYYGMGWIRPTFGKNAGWIVFGLLLLVYLGLLWLSTRYPTPEMSDLDKPGAKLPLPGPTTKSGLHFILPVIVLVWALMVDRLSPGLSAFWASAYMIFILLTQRPLKALMSGRARAFGAETIGGIRDLIDGLAAGARNMIGIGIATATAGIIVGAVSQTGVGSSLAAVVEVISGGNLLAILFLTALLSLILGMGLPTTANYIVVSALLAPVIVILGQQNGLIVPLIAVHLFVFYFGIMADVTPPVGLASFAAAAVSGGDPIRTGVIAFFYSIRTAALPFLFIFNTDLLLIDVGWAKGIFVFVVATIAMLLFVAATMGWFITRNRFWEGALLLLIALTLFRPGLWMDMIFPPFAERPATQIVKAAEQTPAGEDLRIRVAGLNPYGDHVEFFVVLPIGNEPTGEERLEAAGVELIQEDGHVIVDNVAFGSAAEKAGLDWDQEVVQVFTPIWQPSRFLMYIPALLALAGVVWLQRRRAAKQAPATSGVVHKQHA